MAMRAGGPTASSLLAEYRAPAKDGSKYIRFNHHGLLCGENRPAGPQVLYVSRPSYFHRAGARKFAPLFAAEFALMAHYKPEWNESGFGSKVPGKGRPGTERVSRWNENFPKK